MDIRPLTDGYAVSPQITPEDLPAIRAAGYRTIINNRPDGEIPSELADAAMRAAAAEAGLAFVSNPVIGGAITMENVRAQQAALDCAEGPVLAYCASGNRSSIVWALANAGRVPVEEMIARTARHGYRLEGLKPEIEALAARQAAGGGDPQ